MRVALLTTFVASRKEPLAEMLQRIYQAFSGAGLGEPAIRFNFGDGPLGGHVSSVDRVLKRHPELTRFVTSAVPMPLIPGARRITNDPLSPAAGEAVPFATLHAIASGVPRSFPFHNIDIHFHSPEFGELIPAASRSPEMMSGILLSDNWWVNGRNRSLSACAGGGRPSQQKTAVASRGGDGGAHAVRQGPAYGAGAAFDRNQLRLRWAQCPGFVCLWVGWSPAQIRRRRARFRPLRRTTGRGCRRLWSGPHCRIFFRRLAPRHFATRAQA